MLSTQMTHELHPTSRITVDLDLMMSKILRVLVIFFPSQRCHRFERRLMDAYQAFFCYGK
jgi:hypothetical protein